MARWDGFSRDETEIGAFGDDHLSLSEQAQFGGFFNSIAGKLGIKKPIEKKMSAAAGKPVKLTLKNPTAGQLATGLGKSALMMAPIVLSAGGAALAAPALLAAAPVVKGVVSTGKAIAPTIKQADKLLSDAQRGVKSAVTTINNTRAAVSAGAPGAAQGWALLSAVNGARVAAGVPAGKPAPAAVVDPALASALASVRTPAEADTVWILASKGGAGSKRTIELIRAAAAKGDSKARAAADLLNGAERRRAAAVASAQVAQGLGGVPADIVAKATLLSRSVAPPKYLVLDTGQVLNGVAALAARLQKKTGWVVGHDGRVGRQ